jgi:predicted transcriptional regulator
MNLLSTHGVVLAAIAKQPDIRLRDLASALDVTERTVWRAVEDLVSAGVLKRKKVGRRNTYSIVGDAVIGDSNLDITVAALLQAIGGIGPMSEVLEGAGVGSGDDR